MEQENEGSGRSGEIRTKPKRKKIQEEREGRGKRLSR